MNIKDKLKRLDRSIRIEGTQDLPDDSSEAWISEFERELDSRILREKNSLIFLKENYFPLYDHSIFKQDAENHFIFANFDRITRENRARKFNFSKTLFIDLETTGLSGGAGTFAFLIGLGHIELDHIVVRQYILPDFQYEWLMLKHIENNLASFDNLISFNGKSFDIPLLKNRFILNRMESILDDMLHVDILHASRRLWKRRLISCDLQNLEYAILGQERIDDIPGEMIPQIYFEYIRKRKAMVLRNVLEHNYYDIVNMILLAIQIGRIGEDPWTILSEEDDFYSLAKYYYQNKYFSEAVPILQYLRQNSADKNIQKDTIFLLSMILKKTGNHEESGQLFRELLSQHRDHPQAIEELAKYYEHQEKNYAAALELVEYSLEYADMLQLLSRFSPLEEIKEALLHRQRRLRNKISRMKLQDS